MENYERYMFVKEYKDPEEEGSIPYGAEITIMGNTVYFNGGLVGPAHRDMLLNFVFNEKLRSEYLRKLAIPYNKI